MPRWAGHAGKSSSLTSTSSQQLGINPVQQLAGLLNTHHASGHRRSGDLGAAMQRIIKRLWHRPNALCVRLKMTPTSHRSAELR